MVSLYKRIFVNILAGAIVLFSLCSFAEPPTQTSDVKEPKKKGKQPIELPDMNRNGFKVSAGQMVMAVEADSIVENAMIVMPDSIPQIDSLTGDTLFVKTTPLMADSIQIDSLSGDTIYYYTPDGVFTERIEGDSITIQSDSLTLLEGTFDIEEPILQSDTTLFPLSYMTLVSAAIPTFGQFYNRQYWKVPIMLAAIGTPLYFGIKQNQQYQSLKSQYTYLSATTDRGDMDNYHSIVDPVQRDMIMHNTWRQLLFGGAIAAYIYTLYDAVTNYPDQNERIRMATTLSFVCPGLGQLYNGSYWKLPLFIGGFATFGYIIDWNNRGYVRYDTAYKLQTDDDPLTLSEFETGNGVQYTAEDLKVMRSVYRRNRDLSIILTAVWYFINILDAHVDAQLKDYDISDDLAKNFTIEPVSTPMFSQNGTMTMSYGLGVGIKF